MLIKYLTTVKNLLFFDLSFLRRVSSWCLLDNLLDCSTWSLPRSLQPFQLRKTHSAVELKSFDAYWITNNKLRRKMIPLKCEQWKLIYKWAFSWNAWLLSDFKTAFYFSSSVTFDNVFKQNAWTKLDVKLIIQAIP